MKAQARKLIARLLASAGTIMLLTAMAVPAHSQIRRSTMDKNWELRIFHEVPDFWKSGNCLAVGDVDGDGHNEIIAGGREGLFWYRPDTEERGTICKSGNFAPELRLEDLDGDGIPEVVGSHSLSSESGIIRTIEWFKPGDNTNQPWEGHILHPDSGGHDIIFVDLDGDGERELLAHNGRRGTAIHKRGGDLAEPWEKYDINTRVFREGLAAADFDADGRMEVIHGPDMFFCPEAGPYSGPWERRTYAPGFREMCRTVLIDITGNGRPDIVIAESEFMEGRMSWFENRMVEDPENPWIEHQMDAPLIYAHSLDAWHEGDQVKVFMAEMEKGGWDAPYNYHARLILYTTADHGRTWGREIIYQGAGTHQAMPYDIDGDGQLEFVGKECCQRDELGQPKVQIWKRRETPSPLTRFRHTFIDRDKPQTATDILAADIDGDELADVVCGSWWYKTPTWQRYGIPGVNQVHCAYDIDGDGRDELIATRGNPGQTGYGALTSELCWIKPVDPLNGKWEEHPIGTGHGDWPHGSVIASVLPGGRPALITCYHSANQGKSHFPEIFEIPDDPAQHPWPKRVLAEIIYGEEVVPYDIDGDGKLDLVAGQHWLENLGDGTFQPHRIVEGFPVARLVVLDVNGDGRPDVVLGGEVLDFENQVAPFSKLAWFENPEDPREGHWKMHPIDTMRCPHSVGAGDLDGDGEIEIVAGEHDPFWPYRSQCRLYVYKKADAGGRSWYRYTLDDRFEHHDGTKVVQLTSGRPAIIGHGWKDSIYVHLWEMY